MGLKFASKKYILCIGLPFACAENICPAISVK